MKVAELENTLAGDVDVRTVSEAADIFVEDDVGRMIKANKKRQNK